MNILEEIRDKNSRNEVVGFMEMVKINSRMTIDNAMKNWSSNLRLNGLLEVVLKVVERVDVLWNDRSSSGETETSDDEVVDPYFAAIEELSAKIDELQVQVDSLRCNGNPKEDATVDMDVPDEIIDPVEEEMAKAEETKVEKVPAGKPRKAGKPTHKKG